MKCEHRYEKENCPICCAEERKRVLGFPFNGNTKREEQERVVEDRGVGIIYRPFVSAYELKQKVLKGIESRDEESECCLHSMPKASCIECKRLREHNDHT